MVQNLRSVDLDQKHLCSLKAKFQNRLQNLTSIQSQRATDWKAPIISATVDSMEMAMLVDTGATGIPSCISENCFEQILARSPDKVTKVSDEVDITAAPAVGDAIKPRLKATILTTFDIRLPGATGQLTRSRRKEIAITFLIINGLSEEAILSFQDTQASFNANIFAFNSATQALEFQACDPINQAIHREVIATIPAGLAKFKKPLREAITCLNYAPTVGVVIAKKKFTLPPRQFVQLPAHVFTTNLSDSDSSSCTHIFVKSTGGTLQAMHGIASKKGRGIMVANLSDSARQIQSGDILAQYEMLDTDAGFSLSDINEWILQEKKRSSNIRREATANSLKAGLKHPDDVSVIPADSLSFPITIHEGKEASAGGPELLHPWARKRISKARLQQLPYYSTPLSGQALTNAMGDLIERVKKSKVFQNGSEQEQLDLIDTLERHSGLFCKSDLDAGATDLVEFECQLSEGDPVSVPQYPLSRSKREIFRNWIIEMYKKGFIRLCNSSFCSPMLVVPKTAIDGSIKGWRVVADLRKLNARTVNLLTVQPPNCDQIFSELTGVRLMSNFDMSAGFYNIKIRKEDQHKFAFRDPDSGVTWCFTRMPMGAIGATSHMTLLGHKAFSSLMPAILSVYLDDLLLATKQQHLQQIEVINSDGVAERKCESPLSRHILQLDHMFVLAQRAKIRFKAKKCHVAVQEVDFLGHRITNKGISVSPDKVRALVELPVPKDLATLRTWLGLSGYYRRFIPEYAKTTAPLVRLTRKHVTWQWDENCQAAFEQIRYALTHPPLIGDPDYKREFHLSVDASSLGFGSVLWQYNDDQTPKIIGYWSRACRGSEKNWNARELELAGVLGSCFYFRQFLPRKFTVHTDHKNLLKPASFVKNSVKLVRMENELSDWQINLNYVKGPANKLADFVSRQHAKQPSTHLIDTSLCVFSRNSPEYDPLVSMDVSFADYHSEDENISPLSIAFSDEVTSRLMLLSTSEKKGVTPISLHNLNVMRSPGRITANRIKSAQSQSSTYKPFVKFYKMSERVRGMDSKVKVMLEENEISEHVDVFRKQAEDYELNEQGLLVRTKNPRRAPEARFAKKLIVIPASLKAAIMYQYHDTVEAAHPGAHATSQLIGKTYWWPNMLQDIKTHVKTCLRCSLAKARRYAKFDSSGVPPMPLTAFETISVDLIFVAGANHKAVSREGHTHVVSIIDTLTNFVLLEPIMLERLANVPAHALKGQGAVDATSARRAVKVAWVIYKRVYLEMHRTPRRLLCDNGTEFTNALLKELVRLSGTSFANTAARNPQANPVERIHSTIKGRLRAAVNDKLYPDVKNWHRHVKFIEHALNSVPIDGLPVSPAAIIFGPVKDYPAQLSNPPEGDIPIPSTSGEQLWKLAQEWAITRAEILLEAREEKIRRHENSRRYALRGKHARKFNAGDLVKVHRPQIGKTADGTTTKCLLQWTGPHSIIRETHPGTNVFWVKISQGLERKIPASRLQKMDPNTVLRPRQINLWDIDVPRSVEDLDLQPGRFIVIGELPQSVMKKYYTRRQSYFVCMFIGWENESEGHRLARVHVYGYHGSNTTPASWEDISKTKHWPAWIPSEEELNSTSNARYAECRLKFTCIVKPDAKQFEVVINVESILPVRIDGLTTLHQLKMDDKARVEALLSLNDGKD